MDSDTLEKLNAKRKELALREENIRRAKIDALKKMLSFLYPKRVYELLSEHVAGQHEAKKVLSVSAYKHLRNLLASFEGDTTKVGIANVLLAGPTGVGKTFLIQKLAEIMCTRMLHVDCSQLTTIGIVGNSVGEEMLRLLDTPEGYTQGHAIVMLDEIDKLLPREGAHHNGTVGVQYELLRALEGKVSFSKRDMSGEFRIVEIDTSKVLFIGAGAFGGSIRADKTERGVGFGSSEKQQTVNDQLLECGLIPELVGRFANGAVLKPLSRSDLEHILLRSKSSPLATLINTFKRDGIQLKIKDESINKILDQAVEKDVGARGLYAAIEQISLDVQFENLGINKEGEMVI